MGRTDAEGVCCTTNAARLGMGRDYTEAIKELARSTKNLGHFPFKHSVLNWPQISPKMTRKLEKKTKKKRQKDQWFHFHSATEPPLVRTATHQKGIEGRENTTTECPPRPSLPLPLMGCGSPSLEDRAWEEGESGWPWTGRNTSLPQMIHHRV